MIGLDEACLGLSKFGLKKSRHNLLNLIVLIEIGWNEILRHFKSEENVWDVLYFSLLALEIAGALDVSCK